MNTDKIRLIPIPLAGVILSFFGLGLFFKDIFKPLGEIFATVGTVLIVFLLIKLFIFREESVEDLRNPIILGTFGTFFMAIMILATFIKDLSYNIGLGIWILGFTLHVILIIYFTKEYILNFKLELVYTNYFVVYIGIGMGCITGAAFNLNLLVDGIFLFSFISMMVLLILVTYRYWKLPIIENPFKPLVCIYAAPFSLVFCAFIQTSFPKSIEFIIAFYILCLGFYLFGLIKVVEYIRLPFFPTFAAFTFPLVISSTATKNIVNIFKIHIEVFLYVQITITLAVVVYVLLQYIYFVVTAPVE